MDSDTPAPEGAQQDLEALLGPLLDDAMGKLAATGMRVSDARAEIVARALADAHRVGQAAGA